MKINITIPVLNEEPKLRSSIHRLNDWVGNNCNGFEWEIVIADNGSTDRTATIGRDLVAKLPIVKYVRFEERGRGQALSRVWLASDAKVLSYMDVDLSSNLQDFPTMIAAVVSGRAELAIGSRLSVGSQTVRCLSREIISRGYNQLLRLVFRTRIRDTQCGFKVISNAAAKLLLPQVQDRGWFWDSELLLNAERGGCRIFEHPIRWVENRDSRVAVCRTAWLNICGIYRLRRRFSRSAEHKLTRPCQNADQISSVRSVPRDHPSKE